MGKGSNASNDTREFLNAPCGDGHKIFNNYTRGTSKLGVYSNAQDKVLIPSRYDFIKYTGEYLCSVEKVHQRALKTTKLYDKNGELLITAIGNIYMYPTENGYVASPANDKDIVIDDLMRSILNIGNASVEMKCVVKKYANFDNPRARLNTTISYPDAPDTQDVVFNADDLINLHTTIKTVLNTCNIDRKYEPQEDVLYELLYSNTNIEYIEQVLNRRNTELQSSDDLKDITNQNNISQVETALEQIKFIKEMELDIQEDIQEDIKMNTECELS